jgi:hypothetical protein
MCIYGKDGVIAELGYWPEFCDAKITDFSFSPYTEQGSRLVIMLHYIDTDKHKDVTVQITLLGVVNMNFGEFREENVIDKLILDYSSETGAYFEIEACAGIFGSCESRSVSIKVVH